VLRIYDGMKPIIAKFALFGNSEQVVPIVVKFHDNFLRVKNALSASLARIQDAPSTKAAVHAKLEVANEALRGAAAMGVTFFRPEIPRQAIARCDCGGSVYQGDKKCHCGKELAEGRQRDEYGNQWHNGGQNRGGARQERAED